MENCQIKKCKIQGKKYNARRIFVCVCDQQCIKM
uniref:Uncharacterized protein n=1 Tax=Arundo donax TaxID=35708 RepID=A0A0A9AV78_ARUDO